MSQGLDFFDGASPLPYEKLPFLLAALGAQTQDSRTSPNLQDDTSRSASLHIHPVCEVWLRPGISVASLVRLLAIT
jgi:hypothetical protein